MIKLKIIVAGEHFECEACHEYVNNIKEWLCDDQYEIVPLLHNGTKDEWAITIYNQAGIVPVTLFYADDMNYPIEVKSGIVDFDEINNIINQH